MCISQSVRDLNQLNVIAVWLKNIYSESPNWSETYKKSSKALYEDIYIFF